MTPINFDLDLIKQNFKSGLTVALVSIPLSIPLAVASGVSPIVGIITSIWAGLIASLFGGSDYNIIGSTGALSGLISSYALLNGPESVHMLAIFTGILIFVAYLIKFEKYLIFIPSSVIHGFILGIAMIIVFGQINYALGLNNLVRHEKVIFNLLETVYNLHNISLVSLFIFLIFIFCFYILKKILPKIPSAIILSISGIVLGYATTNNILNFKLLNLGDKFGQIKPVLISIPKFNFTQSLFISSFVIALVAILEAILSAKIADSVSQSKSNIRDEMLGLSLANIASGLAGGMPATAALANTTLNIRSGATNRISATINAILVAFFSFVFLSYFKFMPLAVMSAILVYVAFNMVDREHFKKLYLYDRTSFIISIIVALLSALEDPIIGILAGTAISLLVLVNKMATSHYSLIKYNKSKDKNYLDIDKIDKKSDNQILVYTIKGKLVYINTQGHILKFKENFSDYSAVVLVLSDIYYIDLDGLEALEEIISLIEEKDQQIALVVSPGPVESMLNSSKKIKKLANNGLVFENLKEAINSLQESI